MTHAFATDLCAAKPGAERSTPFGPGTDVWKVGGKMFACLTASQGGITLKTDSVETAEMLISAGLGRKAAYFHRSWVNLPFSIAPDELRHRVDSAYRLVRASLPKKQQTSLPE